MKPAAAAPLSLTAARLAHLARRRQAIPSRGRRAFPVAIAAGERDPHYRAP